MARAAVRLVLQELDTIGEVEVFREELRNVSSGEFQGLSWRVRFYATGDPAHIGPQSPLLVDTSGLSLASSSDRRRLHVPPSGSSHIPVYRLGRVQP